MGTEFYAFEMLTGRRLTPLPATAGDWSLKINTDEATSCGVPARAAVTAKLDIWGSTVLARNGLLAVVDGEPVAAGPLWKRSYKGGEISLTGGGLRSYWERRILLPVDARTEPLINEDGSPNVDLDTIVENVSYGTIAKRWVQLVNAWPGGSIPMMLPADVVGTRRREVKAVDLKNLRKLLDDLTGVIGGPDISFRPRWAVDGLGIYWEMQTGTEEKPTIGSDDPSLIRWTVGAERGGAFDLEVTEDATMMTEEVFATAGRSADKVIASRARSTILPAAGFPLLQSVDTSHGDVSEQDTLDEYAEAGADEGRYVASFWSMRVRAREKGTPALGDYWIGDLATIDVDKAEPVLPAGSVTRRIAGIGGDLKGGSYSIAFAEALA